MTPTASMEMKVVQDPLVKIAVYLDDVRTPTEQIPGHEWVIVRNYDQFVNYITNLYKQQHRLPDHISFDHDLGDQSMEFYFQNKGSQIRYDEFEEKTGLHCAKWFTAMCDKNEISAKFVYMSVHSHNPIGATNIQQWLNFWKMKKYGPEYAHCYIRKFAHEIEPEALDNIRKIEAKYASED